MSQAPSRTGSRRKEAPKRTDVEVTEDIKNKYKDKSDIEIREIRAKLVKELKLEEVAELDAYVKTRVADNSATILENSLNELNEVLDKTFNDFDNELKQAEINGSIEELKARNYYNNIFKDTQEKHISEIATLYTEKQLELIKASTRGVAKEIEYQNKARILAGTGAVEEAFKAKDQADAAHDDVMRTREDDLNMKYKRVIGKVQERQGRELYELNDNLEKAIIAIQTSCHAKIEQLIKMFVVKVRAIKVKKISDGSALLRDPSKKPEFSEALTSFVEKKLWDAEKADYFRADK